MRIPLVLAAALVAAPALSATTPRIVDAASVVDYTPDFGGQFLLLGFAPIAEGLGLAPAEIQIDGALADPGFVPALRVTDAAGEVLLEGLLASFALKADGVLAMRFDVTADAFGAFGRGVAVSVALGLGPDPLAAAFSVNAATTLAPVPVPLPAGWALLAVATAATTMLGRWRA